VFLTSVKLCFDVQDAHPIDIDVGTEEFIPSVSLAFEQGDWDIAFNQLSFLLAFTS
jgi:hypothetical protein